MTNAYKMVYICIVSLALIGVAEAQKGGGKPGGGGTTPPPPYTPVIVNVACDGTGTKLQDALNALNPVANVYEVRVSGVCPEPLTIEKFQYLTITSVDNNNRGVIGPLLSIRNFNTVVLKDLIVEVTANNISTSRSAITVLIGDWISLERLLIRQASSIVRNLISASTARVDIDSLSTDGFESARMSISRNGYLVMQFSGSPLPFNIDSVMVRESSFVLIENCSACVIGKIIARSGSSVLYLDIDGLAANPDFEAYNSTISGYSDVAPGSWFGSLSCFGNSWIGEDDGFYSATTPANNDNYCLLP